MVEVHHPVVVDLVVARMDYNRVALVVLVAAAAVVDKPDIGHVGAGIPGMVAILINLIKYLIKIKINLWIGRLLIRIVAGWWCIRIGEWVVTGLSTTRLIWLILALLWWLIV